MLLLFSEANPLTLSSPHSLLVFPKMAQGCFTVIITHIACFWHAKFPFLLLKCSFTSIGDIIREHNKQYYKYGNISDEVEKEEGAFI